jgi:hypothetical protein
LPKLFRKIHVRFGGFALMCGVDPRFHGLVRPIKQRLQIG